MIGCAAMLVQSGVGPYLGLAILCLAIWAPAGAAAWTDCAEEAGGECCDVGCSVCACCAIGTPATLLEVRPQPVLPPVDLADQAIGPHLAPDPRGVLHVPRALPSF